MILVATLLTLNERGTDLVFVSSMLFVVLVGAIFAQTALSRQRVRREPISIALAGLPGAGKTVYVNLLFSVLMETEVDGLRFTAEARTARAVYQTTKRLRSGAWPAVTGNEVVLYKGQLEPPYDSFVAFFWGRSQVVLEIGDAPGEVWEGFGERQLPELAEGEPLDLVDSSYFDYVAGADAVFYLISAYDILESARRVEAAVDEAVAAFQLLKSVTPTNRSEKDPGRIFIPIISKADLLSDEIREVLFRLFHSSSEFSLLESLKGLHPDPNDEVVRSLAQIERLVAVVGRRERGPRGFLVSSIVDGMRARLVEPFAFEYPNAFEYPRSTRHVDPVTDPLLAAIRRAGL